MFPCLIIVSRDAPELLDALVALYGQTEGVAIRFDQWQALPWTGPGDTPVRRPRTARTPQATIGDVARRAGVSRATVSRVLNQYPHVRPPPQPAVQRALRYRPD